MTNTYLILAVLCLVIALAGTVIKMIGVIGLAVVCGIIFGYLAYRESQNDSEDDNFPPHNFA